MNRIWVGCLMVVATGCGGAQPLAPTRVVVSAVTPAVVSTTGGATVTVTGTGFTSAAIVTIDGAPVTGVSSSGTQLTFPAPVRAAGSGVVTVIVGSDTASGTLTFVAPSGSNLPPTITNLRTVGSRSNQPSLFMDLNEDVQLIATVTNAEPDADMTYAWAVGAGSTTGSGAAVVWHLPAALSMTPVPVIATLTVTERYVENGVPHRNVANASVSADVHDSSAEILAKGFTFLDRFSQSHYTTAEVVSDFAPSCYGGNGRVFEAGDVDDNRETFLELPGYVIAAVPPVTINFGGACVLTAFAPDVRTYRADACSVFNVTWHVRYLHATTDDEFGTIPAGTLETSTGQDYVSAALQSGVWKLCTSDFSGHRTVTFPSGVKKVGRVIR